MAELSIIIPVYNARDYIVTCLDSIIFQSYKDIEVILVDDRGTDGSIELVKDYLGKYRGDISFRITSTESNSGPAKARNKGLAEATGEYVCFMDADDRIETDFCERLLHEVREHNADIACGSISLDRVSDGSSIIKHNPSVKSGHFDGKRKSRYLTHFTSYFTTYIFRREMLEKYDITFPDTRSSEDSCFLSCALLAAGRIASDSKAIYHYMLRDSSLSLSYNDKRYLQKIDSFSSLISFAREHGLYETHKEEIDYIYIKKGFLTGSLTFLRNSEQERTSTLKSLHRRLLQEVPDYRSNHYYKRDVKVRLLVSLIRTSPLIASRLIGLYIRKSKKML